MAKLKRTYHRKRIKKDREITETDKAFYKLGLQDGEGQLKRTISLIKTTNRHLLDELLRLDREDATTGVLLSFEQTKRIIKALKKPKANPCRAKFLQKKLTEAQKHILYLDELLKD